MLAFFMAHGAPTIYLENNSYTAKLKAFRQDYPNIQHLVMVSAHSDKGRLDIATKSSYKTIHDFGGFPDELYQVQMATKGNPELAKNLIDRLKDQGISATEDPDPGLDHGAWTVLKLIDPKDELTVVNVTFDADEDPKRLMELGEMIGDWLPSDTALIFSGGLVHNLRAVKWGSTDVDKWATEFEAAIENALNRTDTPALLNLKTHPAYRLAVPTPEHFSGLYLVYGTIRKKGSARLLSRLYQFGNLGLDYWEFKRD